MNTSKFFANFSPKIREFSKILIKIMKNWQKIVIYHWIYHNIFWRFLLRPGGSAAGTPNNCIIQIFPKIFAKNSRKFSKSFVKITNFTLKFNKNWTKIFILHWYFHKGFCKFLWRPGSSASGRIKIQLICAYWKKNMERSRSF